MHRLAACALAVALAGCLSPGGGPLEVSPLDVSPVEPRVVVGLVDSGINPYHDVFRDAGAVLPMDFLDARTGQAPIPLMLSTDGSFKERVERDAAVWASVEPGTLYWFRGTRLLAVSLLEHGGVPLLYGDHFHGTGTASVVRNVSGDAWIVLVQIPTDVPAGGREGALAGFQKSAAGIMWLADQPWVDILSLSIGFEGNPPLPMWAPFAAATKVAVEGGKPVVVGAANLPAPTIQSGTNGPPWVISVGGAEGTTQGVQPRAGNIVDVTADFTRVIAGSEPDEYFVWRGTSFGTPVVAATLAQALLELRLQSGHEGGSWDGVLCSCSGRDITQTELRSALNASAVYFETADWDPLNYSSDPVQLIGFATAPVVVPWVQMGWGYVGDGTWRVLVDALTGAAVPPAKPEAARMHMAAQQALREAYWSR